MTNKQLYELIGVIHISALAVCVSCASGPLAIIGVGFLIINLLAYGDTDKKEGDKP